MKAIFYAMGALIVFCSSARADTLLKGDLPAGNYLLFNGAGKAAFYLTVGSGEADVVSLDALDAVAVQQGKQPGERAQLYYPQAAAIQPQNLSPVGKTLYRIGTVLKGAGSAAPSSAPPLPQLIPAPSLPSIIAPPMPQMQWMQPLPPHIPIQPYPYQY